MNINLPTCINVCIQTSHILAILCSFTLSVRTARSMGHLGVQPAQKSDPLIPLGNFLCWWIFFDSSPLNILKLGNSRWTSTKLDEHKRKTYEHRWKTATHKVAEVIFWILMELGANLLGKQQLCNRKWNDSIDASSSIPKHATHVVAVLACLFTILTFCGVFNSKID